MSDDNKLLDQNANASLGAVGNPVGSPRKEEETPTGQNSSEFVNPSEAEPQISQELAELGIEAREDRPDLTEEHKQAGLKYAGPSVPPQTEPSGLVQLPLTREEAMVIVKTKKINDSVKWLADLVLKALKAMGI